MQEGLAETTMPSHEWVSKGALTCGSRNSLKTRKAFLQGCRRLCPAIGPTMWVWLGGEVQGEGVGAWSEGRGVKVGERIRDGGESGNWGW